MKKTELKELVKRYFDLTEKNTENITEEVKEQSFAEATLADGTKITNKMEGGFEVGQELYVITEEGEEVLAPSGEHTSESGISITVDESGVITGIHHPDQEGEGSLEAAGEEVEPEGVSEVQMAEHDEEEAMEDEEAMMEDGEAKEAIVEAIAEIVMPEIAAMKEELSSCMSKLAEHEEKMGEYEEKMKEHMSATPASESKTTARFSKKQPSNLNNIEPIHNKKRYEMALANLKK